MRVSDFDGADGTTPEQRLEALGLTLPPAPAAAASNARRVETE